MPTRGLRLVERINRITTIYRRLGEQFLGRSYGTAWWCFQKYIPLGALAVALAGLVALAACATRTPPTPAPDEPPTRPAPALRSEVGLASYYGREFHGRRTASGQRFDMRASVAAHPDYPFGTRVRVTNLTNQRQVVVTIVDRGPTAAIQANGVIIDVSQGAAEQLAFIRAGRVRVRVDVLEWGR